LVSSFCSIGKCCTIGPVKWRSLSKACTITEIPFFTSSKTNVGALLEISGLLLHSL
jgi:hypothetical protein